MSANTASLEPAAYAAAAMNKAGIVLDRVYGNMVKTLNLTKEEQGRLDKLSPSTKAGVLELLNNHPGDKDAIFSTLGGVM